MSGFETILNLDKTLFIALNGLRSEFLDPCMIFLSSTWVWAPMYLLLILHIIKTHKMGSIRIVLWILLVFLLTDFVSASILKPFFARLRPCHDPALSGLFTLLGKCGGKYSFPSSHAANTMGLAAVVHLMHSKKIGLILICWSLAVGYSRIYLGVHYPLDILGGVLLGAAVATLAWVLHQKLKAG